MRVTTPSETLQTLPQTTDFAGTSFTGTLNLAEITTGNAWGGIPERYSHTYPLPPSQESVARDIGRRVTILTVCPGLASFRTLSGVEIGGADTRLHRIRITAANARMNDRQQRRMRRYVVGRVHRFIRSRG